MPRRYTRWFDQRVRQGESALLFLGKLSLSFPAFGLRTFWEYFFFGKQQSRHRFPILLCAGILLLVSAQALGPEGLLSKRARVRMLPRVGIRHVANIRY